MPTDDQPDCSLSPAQQTRNVVIYALIWGLIYLASPVTYIGVLQATLLKALEFGDTQANLPAGVYLWAAPLAVLVIWYFPQVRRLKSLLVGAFLLTASTSAVATTAVLSGRRQAVLAALVVHAAVQGAVSGVVSSCLWEVIGRGVSTSRRGQALGLAFGFGPFLAVVASLGSQFVLAGKVEGIDLPVIVPEVGFPWNFALVFAASVPVLATAGLLSALFVVEPPPAEVQRLPLVPWVVGGARDYFGHRLIPIAALAYILVYSGHMIFNNISLNTKVVLGKPAQEFAGLLLAERFGFKIVAGFALGWLLIRTSPRVLLIVTALLTLASVSWAMWVPGRPYLLSFGILGAGELFGVYYPNYILGCSPKEQMRRNMAFTSLITMPVGFAAVFYGFLSDAFGREDARFGFQVSFAASMAILVATILLVLVLPARPRLPGEKGPET